ncbi:hypothetical protein HB13667_16060 [Pseudomonas putida]|uniref:Uncharacterized protein n=1 Tax=Pseudomonas putida TaxID=303 RepID=A0A0P7CNK0_PSEPU|nr:hypothetical protein HB13667_16060 [Pseudomonas putida]
MRPAPSTAPPQVRIERELSPRAVLTGVALGILLTPSNVYAGLRIGWSFNMSIIALLVGFTLWQGLAGRSKGRPAWTLHESKSTRQWPRPPLPSFLAGWSRAFSTF